mmetsp:Transcript_142357/g.354763  ORF Transcript_142357/g.354763 Transcript_142357/m.354763 type:complete len:221 (-) Transcript_142357:2062-2724(-)
MGRGGPPAQCCCPRQALRRGGCSEVQPVPRRSGGGGGEHGEEAAAAGGCLDPRHGPTQRLLDPALGRRHGRQGELRAPRGAVRLRATGEQPLGEDHEVLAAQALDQPRPLRALRGARLGDAVRHAPLDGPRPGGSLRRVHGGAQAVPPGWELHTGTSRVPADMRRGGDDRPLGARLCQRSGHGHRRGSPSSTLQSGGFPAVRLLCLLLGRRRLLDGGRSV